MWLIGKPHFFRSPTEIVAHKTCTVTGKNYSVSFPIEKLAEYESREKHIQDIFPDMTAEQREFLMTGLTPDEWNHIMGEEE